MFDKIKNTMDQMQVMGRLMKDENFRALISNPKVQEVFRDPEFQNIVKEKDFSKMTMHPKFAKLMEDPEVRTLVSKLNPESFMNG